MSIGASATTKAHGTSPRRVVGYARDADVAHARERAQGLLHLVGVHLEAATVDHRADPAVDPDETVVVDMPEVAGAQPTVGGDATGERGIVAGDAGRCAHLEFPVAGSTRTSTPACGRPTAPSFAAPNCFQSAALHPTTSPPSSVCP